MENFENENNNLPKEDAEQTAFEEKSEPIADTPVSEEVATEPVNEEPVVNEPTSNEPTESNFSAQTDNNSGVIGYELPQKINFNNKENDRKPASKGIKIFAVIIALVILLTGFCAAGYYFGSVSSGNSRSNFVKTDMKVYPKPKDTDEKSAEEIYDKLNKSIVGIIAYSKDGSSSQATGVVYTKDGYIITNDHLYANIPSAKFMIYDYEGKTYDAEYVAGDTISDLALLKVKNGKGFTVPQFGDSTKISFGENVVAIGRPGDARAKSSIAIGVVSNVKRRIQITSNYTSTMIQTDCDIFEGSSGGALVNMYGQVIGITSSKSNDGSDSMSFAIPTKTVQRILPQLSKKGRVEDRAKLGITYREITTIEAKMNNMTNTGLYIASVGDDSDLSGLVGEGDIITHVNGKKIEYADIMLDVIEDSYASDKITLTIVDKNSGEAKEYKVKLKANIGESSYSSQKSQTNEIPGSDKSKDGEGGTFNFPKGE